MCSRGKPVVVTMPPGAMENSTISPCACLSGTSVRTLPGQGDDLLVRGPDVRFVAGLGSNIRASDEEVSDPQEPVQAGLLFEVSCSCV